MKSYRGAISKLTGKYWLMLEYDICTDRMLFLDEYGKRYLLSREEADNRLRFPTWREVQKMEKTQRIELL